MLGSKGGGEADYAAKFGSNGSSIGDALSARNRRDGVKVKYNVDGRPYAQDAEVNKRLNDAVLYTKKYSGRDLSGLTYQQRTDFSHEFAYGQPNPWAVPVDMSGMVVYPPGVYEAKLASQAQEKQERATRAEQQRRADAAFIAQRNDWGEIKSMGDATLRVFAPTVREALHHGTMPSLTEIYTGQWKYVGNTAIGLWNAGTSLPISAVGIARQFGYDLTISEFKYTSGELTSAAILESELFVVGEGLSLLKGVGYLDDVTRAAPISSRVGETVGRDVANKRIEFSGGRPSIEFDPLSPPSVAQRTIDSRRLYGYHEAGPYPGSFKRPEVDDPKLQFLVRDMYKGDRTSNPIGTGSTADAARFEFDNPGTLVGGKMHLDAKLPQLENALTNWLRSGSWKSPSDIHAAQEMLRDLRNAKAGRLNHD